MADLLLRIAAAAFGGLFLYATFGHGRPPEGDGSRWRDEFGKFL